MSSYTVTSGPMIEALDFGVFQDQRQLLENVSLQIPPQKVTAIIGPSFSGKSAFLRSLNRMQELDGPVQTSGKLLIGGENIYAPGVDLQRLRRRVGMVFNRPSLIDSSIFENVIMAQRLAGVSSKAALAQTVESCLQKVGLWTLLRDKLSHMASELSVESQQRLCIARVLAADPSILLFDEPTAHLDHPSTSQFEDLISELSHQYTIVLTALTPQQAAHVSHLTAFFWQGHLVEAGPTEEVLTNPRFPQTESYVTGRYSS